MKWKKPVLSLIMRLVWMRSHLYVAGALTHTHRHILFLVKLLFTLSKEKNLFSPVSLRSVLGEKCWCVMRTEHQVPSVSLTQVQLLYLKKQLIHCHLLVTFVCRWKTSDNKSPPWKTWFIIHVWGIKQIRSFSKPRGIQAFLWIAYNMLNFVLI